MADADRVKRWCEETLARGRAAQPSPDTFPLASALVADSAAPAAAREARAFYHDACFDWGDAWIVRYDVRGEPLIIVYAGTDGDTGWLEIFTQDGAPVAAAALDGARVSWDSTERVRATVDAADRA